MRGFGHCVVRDSLGIPKRGTIIRDLIIRPSKGDITTEEWSNYPLNLSITNRNGEKAVHTLTREGGFSFLVCFKN